MEEKLVFTGRGLIGGVVTGEALVCPDSIQGWLGLSPEGVIIEKGHAEEGKSIDGKILFFPGSKGSTGWSAHFVEASLKGHRPLAWGFTKMDSKCASAVVALEIPAISDFPTDNDPCKKLKTGDIVRFDAKSGVIELLERP